MSTLCTEASNASSTTTNHRNICIANPMQAHRTRPDAKAILAKLGKTMTQFFVTRYNQRIDRQAFNNLLTLDDRTLKDIGVTRQDIKWAGRLPLSEDAAMKLEHIRKNSGAIPDVTNRR